MDESLAATVKKLKSEADSAVHRSDFSTARLKYIEAIQLLGGSDNTVLYSTVLVNKALLNLYELTDPSTHEGKDGSLNPHHVRLVTKQTIDEATHVVQLRPTWWKGHFRLGQAHQYAGCWTQAFESFTSALRFRPLDDLAANPNDAPPNLHPDDLRLTFKTLEDRGQSIRLKSKDELQRNDPLPADHNMTLWCHLAHSHLAEIDPLTNYPAADCSFSTPGAQLYGAPPKMRVVQDEAAARQMLAGDAVNDPRQFSVPEPDLAPQVEVKVEVNDSSDGVSPHLKILNMLRDNFPDAGIEPPPFPLTPDAYRKWGPEGPQLTPLASDQIWALESEMRRRVDVAEENWGGGGRSYVTTLFKAMGHWTRGIAVVENLAQANDQGKDEILQKIRTILQEFALVLQTAKCVTRFRGPELSFILKQLVLVIWAEIGEPSTEADRSSDIHGRIIFAFLATSQSGPAGAVVMKFLVDSMSSYPEEPYFVLTLGKSLMLQGRVEMSMDLLGSAGREFPQEPRLLFFYANALRHFKCSPFQEGMAVPSYAEVPEEILEEIREANRAFLRAAPIDHVHVPGIFYTLAYLTPRDQAKATELYQEGLRREAELLPCFRPYLNGWKPFLEDPRYTTTLLGTEGVGESGDKERRGSGKDKDKCRIA